MACPVRILLYASVVASPACNGPASTSPTESSSLLAVASVPRLKLDGDVTSSFFNNRFVLHAQLQRNGNTTGTWSYGCRPEVCGPLTFPAATLPVVQLVQPSTAYPWWCVNAADYLPPDWHVLFYVKDVGEGRTSFDEISVFIGQSADCLVTPAPVDEPFDPLDSGDFVGKTRS
jgi:hypothetical protein